MPRRLAAGSIPLLLLVAFASARAAPSAPVDVYVFHGEGCPHCATALAFLEDLRADHPHLRVHAFEVWHDDANRALLQAFARAYDREVRGVPVIVVGDAWWTG
ncbi:MAG: glutaredoxin domain-containing protein, partial [Trueperaceae bacterium]|nr:glutaredoxin domain-containing protein [Trueperaceae bacterium]